MRLDHLLKERQVDQVGKPIVVRGRCRFIGVICHAFILFPEKKKNRRQIGQPVRCLYQYK
jgi:hypothetical protein